MNKATSRILFIILSCGSFLSSYLSAQVSTPIVGFQKVTVPVGLTPAGIPLLNKDILKATITSRSGNTLSIAGQSNIGALLSANEPYYLEVYSGGLKGDRFDVDTVATQVAANGSVVLNSSSANNTFAVSSIGSSLDGALITIRKHITLEQVGQSASPALKGNNSSLAADQVQFYNPSVGSYDQYFLRGDGITWRKVGTTDVANKVVIPPGVGIFILKKDTATEITSIGDVRQNDFALPLIQGVQLVAPAFPIDNSPSSLGMTSANGWTGNNSSLNADQVQIYNPSTGSYDQYFLRGDGITWRKVGTTESVTTAQLFNGAGSVFISRKAANPDQVIVNQVPQ